MMAAPGGQGVPSSGSGPFAQPPHPTFSGGPPTSTAPYLPRPSFSQGDSLNVGKAPGGQILGPPTGTVHQAPPLQGGSKAPQPNGPYSVNGGTAWPFPSYPGQTNGPMGPQVAAPQRQTLQQVPSSGFSMQTAGRPPVFGGTPTLGPPMPPMSSLRPPYNYTGVSSAQGTPNASGPSNQAANFKNTYPGVPQGPPVTSAPPRTTVAPPPTTGQPFVTRGPPPPAMYGPPPTSTVGLQYPSGMAPPPVQGPPQSTGPLQAPPVSQVLPPPPTSAAPQGGSVQRPRYPQQLGYSQAGSFPPTSLQNVPPAASNGSGTGGAPYLPPGRTSALEPPPGGLVGYDPELHSRMAGMSVNASFNKMWGNEPCNLLQDRNVLPKTPEEPPRPVLPREGANCSPDIFRCTLTKIPETQSLLQKARLPLGILIHPFRDINHLPVIQTSTIVRCRSCRTYINPYVQFVERQKWKCNICFRINILPDDFMYDPSSRKYGEPERRPEVQNATVEFIAPSEYMLRPPQPAVYLFVLDVSHGAIQTGYLSSFCRVMLEELNNLPGDSRTQVGFITFDSSVHFYNLGEGTAQPQMLVVSDIEDVFLPSPDGLLVNIHECKTQIQYLLESLPDTHARNGETSSALGAAIQAAYKLMSPIGGRVSVFQTCLPTIGPGSLKPREDPNQRAGKEIANLLPAVDFYKKLALDCSSQQVAVDLFLLGSQYMDIASIACISKYSAGSMYYYPGYHCTLNKSQVEKFEAELRYYICRKIGFEAVMRIRCTKGLVMHTFHGNFFVRSTDLLSLPNVNPDAGFAMQLAIEESLTECNVACFQAAVLYTSSQGERRIRVHTLSLPVTALVQDILSAVDQEAVVGLLCKMAVDRSLSSSVVDARDAMVNACLDLIQAFQTTLPSGQAAMTGLPIPYCARLLPLYVLALMKHLAFRVGVSTKLDDRVFAMEQMKTMPLSYLMTYIYPALYPVHMLDDENAIQLEDETLVPQPPRLQLTFEKVDRHGCYLLDTVDRLYLYVGRAVSDHFCTNVLGVPQFAAIPEDMTELPELSTPESERVRIFISWILMQRPYYSPLRVIREDSKDRHLFVQHLVDDRTESVLSYYEFLQHLKHQLSK